MADEKKYSARQAAMAVLAKAQEVLAKSELIKAETGHEKGINVQSDPTQRSRVMMGTSKAGSQMPLSRDPKTRSEDLHDAKKEHKKVLGEMKGMPKPNLPKSEMGKAENPDKNADAKLGEEVEHLCEDHMMENKAAERKEGHKIVEKSECHKCMAKSESFSELYGILNKMEKAEASDENEIGTKFVKAENKEAPSNSMDPKVKEAPDSSNPPNKIQDQKAPQANPVEAKEGNNPPSGAVPGNGIMKLSHFMGHRSGKKKMKKGIALS